MTRSIDSTVHPIRYRADVTKSLLRCISDTVYLSRNLIKIFITRKKHTGLLRASMVSYYGGDTIINLSAQLSSGTQSRTQSRTQYKKKTFVTGSKYSGEFGTLGMTGAGTYKMPHGVDYDGGFNAGEFAQMGILYFPNGSRIQGFWFAGKLIWSKYYFNDNWNYHHKWRYCKMPDRRFYTERQHQLEPYDVCQLTNKVPHRAVPSGCYDTGDGFYSPKTKCVTHPTTGKILRIPTKTEEEWIIKNCRKGNDENVGFRRDLYENWFDVDSSQEDYMSTLNLKMPIFEGLEEDNLSSPVFEISENSGTFTGTHVEDTSAILSSRSQQT